MVTKSKASAKHRRVYRMVTQKKIIKKISDAVLFQEAKNRKAALIKAKGKYATMKKYRRCVGCHGEFSTRELRSHTCPSGLSWKKRYPADDVCQIQTITKSTAKNAA